MSGTLDYRAVSFGYPDGPDALDAVDLAVTPGDVMLVVGSSGSGKSTLLRAANGLVPHSTGGRFRGDGVVAGRSTRDHPPRLLADVVGFVHQDPEAQFVVDRVESDIAFGLENLAYFARILRAPRERIDAVLETVGLRSFGSRVVRTLSGGELSRVSLATALLGAPEVLVLDEPTVGLDPVLRRDLWDAFQALAEGGATLLVSSHVMDEAARCHDIVLLREGEIIAAEPPASLLARTGAPDMDAAFLALVEGS